MPDTESTIRVYEFYTTTIPSLTTTMQVKTFEWVSTPYLTGLSTLDLSERYKTGAYASGVWTAQSFYDNSLDAPLLTDSIPNTGYSSVLSVSDQILSGSISSYNRRIGNLLTTVDDVNLVAKFPATNTAKTCVVHIKGKAFCYVGVKNKDGSIATPLTDSNPIGDEDTRLFEGIGRVSVEIYSTSATVAVLLATLELENSVSSLTAPDGSGRYLISVDINIDAPIDTATHGNFALKDILAIVHFESFLTTPMYTVGIGYVGNPDYFYLLTESGISLKIDEYWMLSNVPFVPYGITGTYTSICDNCIDVLSIARATSIKLPRTKIEVSLHPLVDEFRTLYDGVSVDSLEVRHGLPRDGKTYRITDYSSANRLVAPLVVVPFLWSDPLPIYDPVWL